MEHTAQVEPDAAPVASALVEVFGHRRHYGVIREVEAFGTKLLEITDATTGTTHRYGGASIFSITDLSQAEMDRHYEHVKRENERMEAWRAQIWRTQRSLERDVEETSEDGDDLPL